MKQLRTVNRKIPKSSTRSSLDLRVMTSQEEKNWVERIPSDGSDFLLGDFSEGQSSTSLEVDVVREGKRRQCREWLPGKEVGCCPVCNVRMKTACKHTLRA